MNLSRQLRIVSGATGMLFACAIALCGQSTFATSMQPCSTELPREGETCTLTLSPGQSLSLPLTVPVGNIQRVIAEQAEGTVELQLSDAASQPPTPYTNHAGRHSRIRILVAPGQTISIGNSSKEKPAKVLLTVDPAFLANSNTEMERAAERAFAQAELLRVQDAKDRGEVVQSYDRAIVDWQATDNKENVARALIWKAFYVFFKQNDSAAALPIAVEAGKLISSLGPVEAANCWKISGFIHAQLAQYDAGADAYRAALSLFEETDDLFNQEVVLDNLAKLERLQGKTEAALDDAKKAANLAAKLGDPRRELGIQEEIGAIYLTEGNLESAYDAYENALSLLYTVPDPRLQGYIWSDVGVLYTQLGDYARAADALEQAMAIWQGHPNPAGELNTLNDYGDLLLKRNQLSDARKYYSLGLELAEKNSIERARVFLLRGIGKSYLQQGDSIRAEESLQRSLKLARDVGEGDSIAETLCLLGDTAWQRHDLPLAEREFEECRKASVGTHDSYMEIQAEGGMARVAFQTGALESAESHCETALAEIEAEREHLQTDNLKTLFFASLHAYYDMDVQILERLDELHPQEGYRWEAFLAAERARSRTLSDEMAGANTPAPLRATASSALLAQYEDVERRLRGLETSAVRQRNSQGRVASGSLRSAIARLTVSEHQLHREIQAAGAPDSSRAPALTLQALENALPDRHAALIEYWVGEKASYAWSITHTGIRAFRLPPAAALERECAAFRKALLAASSADPRISAEQRAAARPALENRWRNLGWQLAGMLFPPGMLSPSTHTVFIVGDGAIESVPLAALPKISMTGDPKFVLRNRIFLNEPSAYVFSVLEANPIQPHSMRLALFTVDQNAVQKRTQDARSNSDQILAPLHFAKNETELIRTAVGSNQTRVFSGSEISKTSLQNLDWSGFSIGHFAMHAVLNKNYAELSGLAFGNSVMPASGNLLWYGDIRNLHARLDLVVLSACDTALGEQVPGEGLRGLTQAFFAAGSQRVLGTLWEIDDQATSVWMGYFYRALKQTHSPTEALHHAQRRMAADPQWNAPYYWAGFSLAGDWRSIR